MKKVLAFVGVLSVMMAATPVLADSTNTSPAKPKIKQMVTINTAGNATLSGTLKAITPTTLTISSWGGDWTANISTATKMWRKEGIKAMSAEMAIGDEVMVRGKASATGAWMIDASMVQDKSIQSGVQYGTVSAVSGSTFTLTTKYRGTITVTVKPDAKIMMKGKSATLADITNGSAVTVWGVWNTQSSTLMAHRVTIAVKK